MWKQEKIRIDLKIFMVVLLFNASFITTVHIKKPGIIYILEWTTRYKEPFSYMQMKREAFTLRGCYYQNCYLTDNIDYFDNITDFDAILFNIVNMWPRREMELPQFRNDDQIYIFVSTESAANYPVGPDFNMFFNWTMTYKLNSDVPLPYIAVWNNNNEVVGPAANISWVQQMEPISKYIKNKLRNKRNAAAWFVSNCEPNNHRIDFVITLRNEMAQYGLKLDIYGACGELTCPRQRIEECYGLLETNYYFYLAFENSFCDDYFTEKILTAVEHYTVPVLYGGANYSRFMPAGMYLDARVLGPKKTAKKMSNAIRNRKLYYNFFRFHRYYVFHAPHDSTETDPICNFCAKLNDQRLRNERRVYARLPEWWNVQSRKAPRDLIFYYDTAHDSLQNNRSKVNIENPNRHILVLKEKIEVSFLDQFLNYIFQ